MDDHMEYGRVVTLEDGWMMDTVTQQKFRINEDGDPVDEFGRPLIPLAEDEEVDWNEEDYDR